MPDPSVKRPLDPNELAHQLVKEATEGEEPTEAADTDEASAPEPHDDSDA